MGSRICFCVEIIVVSILSIYAETITVILEIDGVSTYHQGPVFARSLY